MLSPFSCVRLCTTPQMAAHQAPPSLGLSRQEHWSGLPFPSPIHESEKWKGSRSVVSDPQRPHGLQPSRLLHPWDFACKSTGVGCHCLLRFHPNNVINNHLRRYRLLNKKKIYVLTYLLDKSQYFTISFPFYFHTNTFQFYQNRMTLHVLSWEHEYLLSTCMSPPEP